MITLTEKAAAQVKKSLEKRRRGIGLRLGVKTVGCSGLAYHLDYAEEAKSDDVRFESLGVAVLVDQKSLPYLDGTTLDFVREGLSEKFKFDNPNVKGECGCGESFTV
ncbi:MAG: HesB/IscA family protein [Burkholderiales bacterium]